MKNLANNSNRTSILAAKFHALTQICVFHCCHGTTLTLVTLLILESWPLCVPEFVTILWVSYNRITK